MIILKIGSSEWNIKLEKRCNLKYVLKIISYIISRKHNFQSIIPNEGWRNFKKTMQHVESRRSIILSIYCRCENYISIAMNALSQVSTNN